MCVCVQKKPACIRKGTVKRGDRRPPAEKHISGCVANTAVRAQGREAAQPRVTDRPGGKQLLGRRRAVLSSADTEMWPGVCWGGPGCQNLPAGHPRPAAHPQPCGGPGNSPASAHSCLSCHPWETRVTDVAWLTCVLEKGLLSSHLQFLQHLALCCLHPPPPAPTYT